ncbi:MAG: BACON domain-containing protein [Ktedonobacteraceae bacterium]
MTVTNTGGDGLTWQAGAPSQAWLTLGLTSGNVTSQTNSPVSFNVNVAGLTSGTYTATVLITPSVGSAQTVTITLTIS